MGIYLATGGESLLAAVNDYRRLLRERAFVFFPERLRLTEVTPHLLAQFVAWLCDQRTPARKLPDGTVVQGQPLSDSTVRNAINPVRACLATAVAEGLLRSNPASGLRLPHRPRVEDDGETEVRALSREELRDFLAIVHPRHRLMFRFMAATGLRVSETFALQWRHLQLDGSRPHVEVRRAIVRGRIQPPKSRYGRRDVPLSSDLVEAFRARRKEAEWDGDDDLVFASLAGTPLQKENVRRRYLTPVAQEVEAPWAGFHTFRHTCASLLFARGTSVKAVQRWLGHHSPAFTLATYVHLLPDEVFEPLELDGELSSFARKRRGKGEKALFDALLWRRSKADRVPVAATLRPMRQT